MFWNKKIIELSNIENEKLYCENCKWYKVYDSNVEHYRYRLSNCMRLQENLITEKLIPAILYCNNERDKYGGCKPNGKFFEAKE